MIQAESAFVRGPPVRDRRRGAFASGPVAAADPTHAVSSGMFGADEADRLRVFCAPDGPAVMAPSPAPYPAVADGLETEGRWWDAGVMRSRRRYELHPSAVLSVSDVIGPGGRTLGDGDMCHEVLVGSAVPVLLTVGSEVNVSSP